MLQYLDSAVRWKSLPPLPPLPRGGGGGGDEQLLTQVEQQNQNFECGRARPGPPTPYERGRYRRLARTELMISCDTMLFQWLYLVCISLVLLLLSFYNDIINNIIFYIMIPIVIIIIILLFSLISI